MQWESATYNLIISKSSQISTGKQIICERTHVYTIPAHQCISKAALPEHPVFVACEVLEISDVFSPFITPLGLYDMKMASRISWNAIQWEGFMGWCSHFQFAAVESVILIQGIYKIHMELYS